MNTINKDFYAELRRVMRQQNMLSQAAKIMRGAA